jgi:hypothetical protein
LFELTGKPFSTSVGRKNQQLVKEAYFILEYIHKPYLELYLEAPAGGRIAMGQASRVLPWLAIACLVVASLGASGRLPTTIFYLILL